MSEDADEDLAVKPHTAVQRLGDRVFQCDATAVRTMPDDTHAYALLDGVGDTPAVRAWTRTAARRLARAAAGHSAAEAGLRADPARHDPDLPAAAVVAVQVPGGWFFFARSGGARAYLLLGGLGPLRQLTEDHNARRACDGFGDRIGLRPVRFKAAHRGSSAGPLVDNKGPCRTATRSPGRTASWRSNRRGPRSVGPVPRRVR